MKKINTVLISLLLLIFTNFGITYAQENLNVSSEQAKQNLIDGNKRYVEENTIHPKQTAQRRFEISKKQRPFAAILSCSDSRVPPEIIFDQGLGDLFVVRLAGNIVDDAVLGSLEYATEHLGIKYIMVLGHESCGAVSATIKEDKITGHIHSFIKAIKPAFKKAKKLPGDILENTVRINIFMVVQQLKSSTPILKKLVKKGELTIEGAYYALDNGEVTFP